MQVLKRISLAASLALLGAAPSFAGAAQPEAVRTTPISTPLGTGAFKAIMEVDPGLPTHTVYRPANLAALGGQKLPIVAWGNGSCANAGNRFRWFLSEIASHGYLVLAVGPIGSAEQEKGPVPGNLKVGAPAPASTAGPPASHSSQLIDAIDWAIKENGRAGSPYRGRIDTTHIAAMGMSCGGAQAIEASFDPRVTTTVAWNSGLFPDPTTMAGGKVLTKDDLKRLHAPIAYISGDILDVAYPNANDDFEKLNGIPVFRAYRKNTYHEGTYGEPNGGAFAPVGVAWLDWRLKGDKAAAGMFVGADCGLCRDAAWVARSKNLVR